jgi:hypothetical protein
MNLRCLLLIAIVPIVGSCVTVPQLDELRSQPPNSAFIVNANLDCLYEKSVEHVSSYLGTSEPRFTWYIDASRRTAWFRQPLTLVEYAAASATTTQVRRYQTTSAAAFGQGNALLSFAQGNPCVKMEPGSSFFTDEGTTWDR